MATSPLAPAGAPGKKTVIKVQASMSDVHNIRLMDTDLVIVLKSGKTAVVPDGAIRAMMDPEFTVQFDDTDVAGSALLRQAGRMEIGDLASVAVSTPPPEDAAVWVNGGTSPVADAAKAVDSPIVPTAPPPKGFAENWAPWAAIVAAGGGLLALATGGIRRGRRESGHPGHPGRPDPAGACRLARRARRHVLDLRHDHGRTGAGQQRPSRRGPRHQRPRAGRVDRGCERSLPDRRSERCLHRCPAGHGLQHRRQ
ncbi:hypothetical protein ACQ86G_14445 [Roseateles chitinivorans]|uniref:hypothetical protein n=1 Tax=Roseateles chitinivorans TaxID=2917965 RepID=UPI003D66D808